LESSSPLPSRKETATSRAIQSLRTTAFKAFPQRLTNNLPPNNAISVHAARFVYSGIPAQNTRKMHGARVSPAMSGTRIHLEGVRREFENGVVALDGFSLDIAPGEFIAILRPSGCGKSTLLRLIAGLDRAQGGSVDTSGDEAIARRRRREIAYVFQDAHLLPWRTVLGNVALPLELMHVDRRERLSQSLHALEQVGLDDEMGRYPNQLSGGMKMRVSLARAMVTRPKLLLLDEPFAALDEITRQRLDEQLRTLWAAAGMTVIFVTHSTSEAVFLADRAVVLSSRPGRIVEDRRIELPAERAGALRATAAFADEARVLYDALERGEAS
jgi:NitT/TauT family transport system ATP-binding protein